MSDRTDGHCQYDGERRCPEPPFARLDFKSATGLRWSEVTCQGDQERRVDQVKAEGGACYAARLVGAAEEDDDAASFREAAATAGVALEADDGIRDRSNGAGDRRGPDVRPAAAARGLGDEVSA